VTYEEIFSPNGHDAFLKDWDELNPIVGSFIDRLESRRASADLTAKKDVSS
jgi:hypothetical protein